MAPSFAFAEWFTLLGFDSTTQKEFQVISIVITQKGSSNSEMYCCSDSERNRFSENWVVNFTPGNEDRKLCIKRNTHRQQERNLFSKNGSKSIILRF